MSWQQSWQCPGSSAVKPDRSSVGESVTVVAPFASEGCAPRVALGAPSHQGVRMQPLWPMDVKRAIPLSEDYPRMLSGTEPFAEHGFRLPILTKRGNAALV
jgi:hypothetical protein